MGTILNHFVGDEWAKGKMKPKTGFYTSVAAAPNLFVLGGKQSYAEALRAQALTASVLRCSKHSEPAVVFSADANVTDQVLRAVPNAVLLGRDASYDPIGSCYDAMEASRVIENMIPLLEKSLGMQSHVGSVNLLRELLLTITDSFGTGSLMYANLETLAAQVSRQHDSMSTLKWMSDHGYQVSESLRAALSDTAAAAGLANLTDKLRLALRPVLAPRDANAPCYSMQYMLDSDIIPIVEIPPRDRSLTAAVICADLENYVNHDGTLVLHDFEVPLPKSAESLFAYSGDSVLFTIVMRSVTTLSEPYVALNNLLPYADTLVCLGMPNYDEASVIARLGGTERPVMMPVVAGGKKGGIGASTVMMQPLQPQHLIAGHSGWNNHGIPDGSAAVFDLRRDAYRIYSGIRFN